MCYHFLMNSGGLCSMVVAYVDKSIQVVTLPFKSMHFQTTTGIIIELSQNKG